MTAQLNDTHRALARRWLPICRAALARPTDPDLRSIDEHEQQMAAIARAVSR